MLNLEEIKRNVRIVEYASMIGFHPRKIGKYYTLKEHDSVRIDPARNIFIRNSTGEGGSIIDFAMCFQGLTFKDAVGELSKNHGWIEPTESTIKEEKEKNIQLPKKDTHMKNVFAYLTKTRGIDREIVQEMIDRKVIYQDIHKNCVFISKDEYGMPKFASIRGTNTYKKFIADAFGCDYSYGLFLSNNADKLIVTECAIDGMSVMNLLSMEGLDYKEYDYLALSGCAKAARIVNEQISTHNYSDVYICLDNDSSGRKTAEELKTNIEVSKSIEAHVCMPKTGKDYNDELISIKEKNRYISISKSATKDIDVEI